MSKKAAQQNDETGLNHDVASAFERAQHHHPHKRHIQEKPVIRRAKEPGLENEKHYENSIENESYSEKDGEIDVEVSERHKRDEEAGQESFSGDEGRVKVKGVHSHNQRSDPHGERSLEERKEIDLENGEHEFSAEDSDIEERHVHGKELRDFNSHHPTDDEDTRTEWKHFQMQLQSNRKNDDEFGYITNAEEEDDSEENYDESLSGERDYDHAHIKTVHVRPRAKQKKHPRDSHVIGKIVGEEDEEVADGLSGEGQGLNSIYDRRDLQMIEQYDESEDNEGSLIVQDDEDVMNLSGAEGLLARDENKILEEDEGDKVLQTVKAKKEKEEPGKKGIQKENKAEPDQQIKNTKKGKKFGNKTKIPKKTIISEKQKTPSSNKNKGPSVNNEIPHQFQKLKVHADIDLAHRKKMIIPKGKTSKNTKDAAIDVFKAQTGTESDLNNLEDFYIDEKDEPKEKTFLVEMKSDKDHDDNTNPEHQKINKRAQTEDDKAEGGQEFRRGNSRHLLQVMNMSEHFNALPGQWDIWSVFFRINIAITVIPLK